MAKKTAAAPNDCGATESTGKLEFLFAAGGAKLLVNENSVQSAEEVLGNIQEISDPNESEVPEGDRLHWRRTVIRIGVVMFVAAAVVGWLLSG